MIDGSRLFPLQATLGTQIERPKKVRLIAEFDDGCFEVITWQRPLSTEIIPPDMARGYGDVSWPGFRINGEPEWVVLPPETGDSKHTADCRPEAEGGCVGHE